MTVHKNENDERSDSCFDANGSCEADSLAYDRLSQARTKPVPFVRAAGARPIVDFLAQLGAPVESLWERAKLPAKALDDRDRFIPLQLAINFTEEASRIEGIDDLGILAAQWGGLEALGALGQKSSKPRPSMMRSSPRNGYSHPGIPAKHSGSLPMAIPCDL